MSLLCMALVLIIGSTAVIGAKPVLKVGTSADFPPFEFQDEKTGAYLGFDVDLIQAVGAAADMEVQIVNTAWDGLIPGLLTGNYDCIVSAMTITDERLKAVAFSDPYFSAGQVIVTRANDTSIQTVEDLEGKKISVQIGTTAGSALFYRLGGHIKTRMNDNGPLEIPLVDITTSLCGRMRENENPVPPAALMNKRRVFYRFEDTFHGVFHRQYEAGRQLS